MRLERRRMDTCHLGNTHTHTYTHTHRHTHTLGKIWRKRRRRREKKRRKRKRDTRNASAVEWLKFQTFIFFFFLTSFTLCLSFVFLPACWFEFSRRHPSRHFSSFNERKFTLSLSLYSSSSSFHIEFDLIVFFLLFVYKKEIKNWIYQTPWFTYRFGWL